MTLATQTSAESSSKSELLSPKKAAPVSEAKVSATRRGSASERLTSKKLFRKKPRGDGRAAERRARAAPSAAGEGTFDAAEPGHLREAAVRHAALGAAEKGFDCARDSFLAEFEEEEGREGRCLAVPLWSAKKSGRWASLAEETGTVGFAKKSWKTRAESSAAASERNQLRSPGKRKSSLPSLRSTTW